MRGNYNAEEDFVGVSHLGGIRRVQLGTGNESGQARGESCRHAHGIHDSDTCNFAKSVHNGIA